MLVNQLSEDLCIYYMSDRIKERYSFVTSKYCSIFIHKDLLISELIHRGGVDFTKKVELPLYIYFGTYLLLNSSTIITKHSITI